MEFKRDSVIALYLAGKSQKAIVRALEHLNVNQSFVSRTISRYRDTGSVTRRQGSGRKKTATAPEMVRKVKKRIDRNPRRSGRKMARELNISQGSMRNILKNELGLKPLKFQKVQDLTDAQKKVRLERAKELLRLAESGNLPNLVFSDEKPFIIEQFVNKQNDRVYLPQRSAENLNHRLATRNQAPAMVMVWAAVSAESRSPLVFVDRGVKINAEYYRENILEGALKPWARKHFGRKPWTFQQDSAPSHSAKVTQEWLKNNVPRFISTTQWPPKSPDANPLDFSVWGILESKVGTKKYQSVEHLKQAIRHEWAKIPQCHLRAACRAFRGRLRAIIDAEGGQFEQK
jgi:inhibitor of nuclear factor kappa-B kinase subunit alpha